MIAIMLHSLAETLSKLSRREHRLTAGEFLFRVGDPVTSLYLVTAGAVRLTRALPHGFQLTLQRAAPGAILAEASLFAGTYHCNASADVTSILRAVPLRRIKAALADNKGLATAFAQHLAHEVHRARAQAETLSLRTVAERVDAWLALHDGSLPAKGRWRHIASEIGVSPEALYRELARRR